MSDKARTFVICLAFLAALSVSCAAPAALITVPNFSFESPGTTTYSQGEPTSWDDTGITAGYANSAWLAGYTGGDGSVSAYANAGATVWSEDSLGTIQSDTTYTLTVAVVSRPDFAADLFELQLFAGDSP